MSIGFGVDLIRTIRNPFDTYEKRQRNTFVSAAVASILSFILIHLINKQSNFLDLREQFILLIDPIQGIIEAAECLINMYSLYVSFQFFFTKGLNKEV